MPTFNVPIGYLARERSESFINSYLRPHRNVKNKNHFLVVTCIGIGNRRVFARVCNARIHNINESEDCRSTVK